MGKRATVRGRDLGKTIGNVVKQIQKFHKQQHSGMSRMLGVSSSLEVANLPEAADAFLSHQFAILQGDENELKKANLQDKIDTLLCLLSHYIGAHTHKSLSGFLDYINQFFEEDKDAQIILSTGHRAKGLEFPRVFIVSSNKLPHPRAKTPEAIIQEHNLMYVMFTRVRYMREVPGSGVLFLGQSEGR
jgi:superfamily I DNA/RNA helicase